MDPKRGSEEPGDQILDQRPEDPDAEASSPSLAHSLDKQANVAPGRWREPAPEEPAKEPPTALEARARRSRRRRRRSAPPPP